MKPTQAATQNFDLFEAVMHHNFDADSFASHFAAAGLHSETFNLEQACALHTRLMSDPVFKDRRQQEIEARQAKFRAEPFAGRFEESLHLADGVVECVLNAMTALEKAELRRRVLRGDSNASGK